MQQTADILRWTLITLQCILVGWMLWSGLWRRLPVWTVWLALEALSRALFAPTGHYAHQIWLQLQPTLLFLLAGAAIEARYQAGHREAYTLAAALCIVPVGIALDLPSLITLRAWLCAGVAALLSMAGGSNTARWQARILGLVAACMAILGWIPAGPTAAPRWWAMRVGFLAVNSAACVAWMALFNRRREENG